MGPWSGQFDLTGKTAVVTGASRGLGVPIAEGLAGAGAHVHLVARKADLLDQVARSIRGWGGSAEARPCDLRDEAQIAALASDVGRLDILVNNAGIGTMGAAEEDRRRLHRVVTVPRAQTIPIFFDSGPRSAYRLAMAPKPPMRLTASGTRATT